MIDFNYTLLIQFANFLVLLVLLNFLLFKPVLRAIGRREKTLGSAFQKAEGLKEDVDRLEKSYDEGARERRKPALEEREATLAQANKASMQLITQARAELSGELTKVKARVEQESAEVFDALKSDVDKLSAEVAEKILKRSR